MRPRNILLMGVSGSGTTTIGRRLADRLAAFLAAATVPVSRDKGPKQIQVDLRPDVLDLALEEGALWLHLRKGSPVLLAAHLLGIEVEAARALEIRKTAALLEG